MNFCLRIFTYIAGMVLFLLATNAAWAGTVTGIMQMQDGTPMSGGKVIVFDGSIGPAPNWAEDLREPDFVEDLNEEGAFRIKLDPGIYYFGALQWLDGRGPGKPVKGDNFFLMEDTPVQVPAEGVVDLGTISQGETIP